MRHRAVEAVGGKRASQATLGRVGAVHEVVDDQLRAAVEELGQGLGACVALERVGLVDSYARELAAPLSERVALPGQLLLLLE